MLPQALQLSDTTNVKDHDILIGMSRVMDSETQNAESVSARKTSRPRHCSKEKLMIQRRSLYALAASAGVALAMLTTAGAAHAHGGVSWSVGIGAPGVAVGVASPQPYYAPPPVYYAPQPVYVPPPPPVYYRPARPVYYAPPVVVAPPAVYYGGGYRGGYGHGHRHHDRHHHRGRDWR